MQMQQSSQLYTLKQLVDLRVESIPFLWQDYIPKQGVGILTGPSDSSKSTFFRQLAFAIAQKQPDFLGKQLNIQRGKVLIISTEDGKISTAAIVRKQNAHQIALEHQEQVLFSFKPIRDITYLDQILHSNAVDIVLLDTWTDTFREDINNAIRVRENLEALSELSEKHGCFFLGIHHNRKSGDPNKPDKQNVLGSQAIEAKSRIVLDLRPARDNKRALTILKHNYVPDSLKNKPVYLNLNPDNLELSVSSEQSQYAFEQSRINQENRSKYFEVVKQLVTEKEYTQDDIVKYLQDNFPNEKTPSKGTVNSMIKEIKGSQSDD